MYQYIIELFLGIFTGLFLGITGIAPTSLILIVLEYFKIGDFKTNLGAVMFLNLFPLTIGSMYEFYKSKSINFNLGIILLFSVVLGSYIGSKMVVGSGIKLSIKNIKYITSFLGLIMFVLFFISAYNEKN